MSVLRLVPWAVWAPALALLAAALRLGVDRRGRGTAMMPLVVLAPLAIAIAMFAGAPGALRLAPIHAVLAAGLVVAILARDRDDLLQSECALKLAWVLGASIALSWAGNEVLAAITGTRSNAEQWAVLQVPIASSDLWRVALPLGMLAGLVLMGVAPFHFWPADLFQGGRAWAAPLAASALQVTGAAWLLARLEGIESLPEARAVTFGLLSVTTGVALVVGAATLMQQRRPERRVGTLASLQGALALAILLGARGAAPGWFERWAAHLALALTGAGLLSRFLPVADGGSPLGGVLFRRHPLTALIGMLPVFSLAGVPGTPGSGVWLEAARALAATHHSGVLLLLGIAWLASFSTVMRQWRESAGLPAAPAATAPADAPGGSSAGQSAAPQARVPLSARAALWVAAIGVAALGVAWAFGAP